MAQSESVSREQKERAGRDSAAYPLRLAIDCEEDSGAPGRLPQLVDRHGRSADIHLARREARGPTDMHVPALVPELRRHVVRCRHNGVRVRPQERDVRREGGALALGRLERDDAAHELHQQLRDDEPGARDRRGGVSAPVTKQSAAGGGKRSLTAAEPWVAEKGLPNVRTEHVGVEAGRVSARTRGRSQRSLLQRSTRLRERDTRRPSQM